jgi:hypothetical protein
MAPDRPSIQVHDKCRAVKTITLDLEAYGALARHKKPGQSISRVIKAHFAPRETVGAFREALRATPISERTVRAVRAA